jgi:hypothetical protein
MSILLNASTSTGLGITSDNSGSIEVQSNGTTKLTVASTGVYGTITAATAQASTSGTSIDFTGIPSWVKKITVMFKGVSTNGTSNYQIQLGSGSVQTSGYVSAVSYVSGGAVNSASVTSGFIIANNVTAASIRSGIITFAQLDSTTWTSFGILSEGALVNHSCGSTTLSGTLDRVRITTVSGTDTFDAGSINIFYEG